MFSVIALMIATLGNTAMGSHQIAFNVWDVVYIPLISIGSAMATRIGHAIGAGDRPGVVRAVTTGGWMTLLIALLCMLVLLAFPGAIVRAYTNDSGIYAMAVGLIRLAALFILLDAVQVAASFSLRAFKDTRFPFIVMCIAYWMFTLPLGYWLGLVRAEDATAGTVGFWQAMIAGITITAVLVVWRLVVTLRRPLPGPPESDVLAPA